jgi:hypothetical protein
MGDELSLTTGLPVQCWPALPTLVGGRQGIALGFAASGFSWVFRLCRLLGLGEQRGQIVVHACRLEVRLLLGRIWHYDGFSAAIRRRVTLCKIMGCSVFGWQELRRNLVSAAFFSAIRSPAGWSGLFLISYRGIRRKTRKPARLKRRQAARLESVPVWVCSVHKIAGSIWITFSLASSSPRCVFCVRAVWSWAVAKPPLRPAIRRVRKTRGA